MCPREGSSGRWSLEWGHLGSCAQALPERVRPWAAPRAELTLSRSRLLTRGLLSPRGAPSAPPSHRPRRQSGSTLDPLWPSGPAQSPGLGPKPRETLSSRGKRQAGLLTFLPGMPCRPGLCPLHSRQPCCGGLVGLPRKYTQVLVPQLPPHKLRLTLSPLLCDSLPILPVKVTPKPIILCITY